MNILISVVGAWRAMPLQIRYFISNDFMDFVR